MEAVLTENKIKSFYPLIMDDPIGQSQWMTVEESRKLCHEMIDQHRKFLESNESSRQ